MGFSTWKGGHASFSMQTHTKNMRRAWKKRGNPNGNLTRNRGSRCQDSTIGQDLSTVPIIYSVYR